MSLIRFDNQVVLVTGAGGGLGAAYAQLFAERGATVIVNDAGVNPDGTGSDAGPALNTVEMIRSRGGIAYAEIVNLSNQLACSTLIDNTITRFGRLDVLVHSAGLVTYKGIEETTNEEWNRMLQINIEAPFWLSRAAWPIMKRQGYGRIVLSVSGYGLKTYDDSDVTAYGVGKAAQFGLMNGLAGEGKKYGILVNAISPVAATRIFRSTVGPNEFSTASVAPGVVLLGSALCPFSGKVLQAVGGKFGVAEITTIKEFDLEEDATPEKVLQRIELE